VPAGPRSRSRARGAQQCTGISHIGYSATSCDGNSGSGDRGARPSWGEGTARPDRTGDPRRAVPPVHVSVKVRLTSGAAPHHGNAPAQLIALLEAHRSAIDVWLRRDAANPHLLLTDPIAAMRKAGVKLAPEVAASLERARGRASAADVLPAGVGYQNPACVGVHFGYEVQIDALGAPDGAPIHRTGAIYNEPNQRLSLVPERPAGQWNSFDIQVSGDVC